MTVISMEIMEVVLIFIILTFMKHRLLIFLLSKGELPRHRETLLAQFLACSLGEQKCILNERLKPVQWAPQTHYTKCPLEYTLAPVVSTARAGCHAGYFLWPQLPCLTS